jgi:hypothetical protein
MLGKKILLNNRIRKIIITERKNARESTNHLLTADYISAQIGRAKSWLSQVENGRLQSVKTNDLVNAFCIIQGFDMQDDSKRKQVADYLDDKIMFSDALYELDIIDDSGNIIDFSEYLTFQSTRGHLHLVWERFNETLDELSIMPIENIENDIKKVIKSFFSDIIEWINRAFNDLVHLFSDEISTKNLYRLIETVKMIYDKNFEYYGLNPLKITPYDLSILKTKLDTDCFLSGNTLTKPLNEYDNSEIDEVIKHYSAEEYMMWKNKTVYLGNNPYPLVVNYYNTDDCLDNFISYQDINKAKGLTEQNYLYIIKQLYTQFDILYQKCKYLMTEIEDKEESLQDIITKYDILRKHEKDMIDNLQNKVIKSDESDYHIM